MATTQMLEFTSLEVHSEFQAFNHCYCVAISISDQLSSLELMFGFRRELLKQELHSQIYSSVDC